MSPAGARTRTARSGVERTNHEVTDLRWVVLNLTGAEVQNERREQGWGGDDFCQEDKTPPLLFDKF